MLQNVYCVTDYHFAHTSIYLLFNKSSQSKVMYLFTKLRAIFQSLSGFLKIRHGE